MVEQSGRENSRLASAPEVGARIDHSPTDRAPSTPPQLRAAIGDRAGALSKIGMRRYLSENRLLLYPDLSDNHSASMEKIKIRSELRQAICKELGAIRDEFLKVANKPIEEWLYE